MINYGSRFKLIDMVNLDEWHNGNHIPTIKACIKTLSEVPYNYRLEPPTYEHGKEDTLNALRALLPSPPPTEAENLYARYATETTGGHVPCSEADMIAFAEWVIAQQSVQP